MNDMAQYFTHSPRSGSTWVHHRQREQRPPLLPERLCFLAYRWNQYGRLSSKEQALIESYYASFVVQLRENIMINHRGKLSKGLFFLKTKLHPHTSHYHSCRQWLTFFYWSNIPVIRILYVLKLDKCSFLYKFSLGW